jgi:hypothetical protein
LALLKYSLVTAVLPVPAFPMKQTEENLSTWTYNKYFNLVEWRLATYILLKGVSSRLTGSYWGITVYQLVQHILEDSKK